MERAKAERAEELARQKAAEQPVEEEPKVVELVPEVVAEPQPINESAQNEV